MSDSNNIYNEFTNFMTLFKNNNSFDTKRNSNIKILPEINDGISLNNTIENSKNTINQDSNKLLSKKKPKCTICKVKINAVDAIISTCKCNKLHCLKHRMPEEHNCEKIEEIGNEQRKNLAASLIKLNPKLDTLKI